MTYWLIMIQSCTTKNDFYWRRFKVIFSGDLNPCYCLLRRLHKLPGNKPSGVYLQRLCVPIGKSHKWAFSGGLLCGGSIATIHWNPDGLNRLNVFCEKRPKNIAAVHNHCYFFFEKFTITIAGVMNRRYM